jgi:hypothetical protein
MDYGADNMPISLKAKLLLRYDLIRYDMRRWPEKVCMWIAWKLPRQLVLWCAVRLMAHATTGQYGNQEPGRVSILDALDRWK